jgi:hypothetical protein
MHLFARQGTKGGGSGVEINHGGFSITKLRVSA